MPIFGPLFILYYTSLRGQSLGIIR
ncbi:unnamed protein product [Acanthoscelides obtectus]|uniref:Uncharacterized protein n=1 Tax=Acanthoscelides obtectus TaxID=200917 RepID=A0A9P0LDR4_ACAOB|nr:unnamed protein product [Acanthoscelides obtectus]CAK1655281.1 hypothetical protein AOBTE_LOCUS19123 [Acanthoscelides obtectus]